MLEERPRLLDRQLAEGQAHVDFDPQRPEPHETVNNLAGDRGIVEQTRLREHLLVVKGDAFVWARIVEVPPGRARVAPSEGELLVVRPFMDDPGPRVGRVGPVEIRQFRGGGRHVADPVFVQPVRACQVVGHPQPPQAARRRPAGAH